MVQEEFTACHRSQWEKKNNFNFSIYGSKGSLKWSYEHANTLNIIFEDSYKLIKKRKIKF